MKKLIVTCIFSYFFLNLNYLNAKWEKMNDGIIRNCFYATHDTIISAHGGILYLTTQYGDGPTTIIPILGAEQFSSSSVRINGNHFYFGSLADGVFVSHDYGKTWSKSLFIGLKPNQHPYLFGFFFAPNGKDIYLRDRQRGAIWYSIDNGDTWNNFTKNFDNPGSTYVGPILFKDTCFYMCHSPLSKTCDKGASWEVIMTPQGVDEFRSSDVTGLAFINNYLFLAVPEGESTPIGYFYKTTDEFKTWEKTTLSEGYRIWNLHTCGNNLFVNGDFYGVKFSSDLGNSWLHMKDGIDTNDSQLLGGEIKMTDKYIYLVQYQQVGRLTQAYRAPIENCEFLMTDVKEGNKHPGESIISPNPATDFIEISVGARHAVSDRSNVRIYDVFGQNCDLTPTLATNGEGVKIDVSSLAPGMYFVRIGDKVSKFVKI